jgi:hypothetical protein
VYSIIHRYAHVSGFEQQRVDVANTIAAAYRSRSKLVSAKKWLRHALGIKATPGTLLNLCYTTIDLGRPKLAIKYG